MHWHVNFVFLSKEQCNTVQGELVVQTSGDHLLVLSSIYDILCYTLIFFIFFSFITLMVISLQDCASQVTCCFGSCINYNETNPLQCFSAYRAFEV